MIGDAANAHTFVDAFRFIGDHPGFLATKALEQLELAGAALGIALLVALPLGIALGHLHRGSGIAIGASYCVMALSAGVWLTLLALQRALTPRALRTTRVLGAGDLSGKELL